ncbi:hypothetical protein K435DRAFT_351935 [Dendrothele bispora CBS 962.96]|uniref:Uncharacterized protein n=1 Tax=Dendrothele bispora (strain CBS 962.96) TaxID=1314807 RepID=A0A4S8MJ02_DENBC|nr:hypothetical protein K435DRAFT_351935 [Dendrothele bispora CBS 962.96]
MLSSFHALTDHGQSHAVINRDKGLALPLVPFPLSCSLYYFNSIHAYFPSSLIQLFSVAYNTSPAYAVSTASVFHCILHRIPTLSFSFSRFPSSRFVVAFSLFIRFILIHPFALPHIFFPSPVMFSSIPLSLIYLCLRSV